MIVTSDDEIIAKARWLNELGKPWHFHILTPECVFNTKGNFALVLETPVENAPYINYSENKQEEAGKILLELLHGIRADDNVEKKDLAGVSDGVRKMEMRAKELTAKGIPWHHHALFPDCIYNSQKGKWKVVLEDPQTNEIMESISDVKPEEDLKVIEPLFYVQKV